MRLLIKNATVITVDPNGTIHAPGAVYVDGARITDVGPSDVLEARYSDSERVIDGTGKLVAEDANRAAWGRFVDRYGSTIARAPASG